MSNRNDLLLAIVIGAISSVIGAYAFYHFVRIRKGRTLSPADIRAISRAVRHRA